jgi:signal transduction histidine kinase
MRPSLRLRFTLACMGLVLAISSLSALGVWSSQEYVEDKLLLEVMQREVDEYARLYREDRSQLPPRSSELRSYVVDPAEVNRLPAELRDLPSGIWHDVLIEGRNYQVANFTLQDKRFYLTYDITSVEEREAWLVLCLALGVLLATGLAGAVGWRLSRVVTAPVTRLAAEIEQLDPERPAASLAQRFPDVELGIIASAFDYYLRRLGDFIVRERAFTEDASHELRTPIAVIATAAERLAGDAALPDALRPAVERIARAAQQMQSTTQALLVMAREGQPAEETMVPLRQAAEEALAAQPGPGPAPVARLGAPGPQVPRALAAIVIGNLLGNAVQHGGTAAVELVQDGARVTVRDGGAGIPQEDLAQLFERGYRSNRSTGFGLGLHIVKRICDRQGWAISFDSAPGQGAIFTVTFTAQAGVA